MAGYVCECCGVSTNLFGMGGGEVMSEEFGVRFLGRVPIDAQWGVLVEEGRRPKYGDGSGGDEGGVREDDGLLVDKYRSCLLCPVFTGIARDVVEKVEGASS